MPTVSLLTVITVSRVVVAVMTLLLGLLGVCMTRRTSASAGSVRASRVHGAIRKTFRALTLPTRLHY